jgi:hypothetical protein
MGEEMSSWIEYHAQRELARRAAIYNFVEASNSQRILLVASIKQELAEFKKHFPNDSVDLTVTADGVVQVIHGTGGPMLDSAKLNWDPIRSVFAFDFPRFPGLSQAIPAVIQDGALVLDFSHSGASMETLVQYILMPVLFPGLTN